MSKSYSDPRYGVEKVLTFPSVDVSATGTTELTLTEDIIVTELGAWVTTVCTGTTGMIAIQESAGVTNIATLILISATQTTAGTTLRQTTMLNSTAASSGQVIVLNVRTACTSGVITPYIKVRERFV